MRDDIICRSKILLTSVVTSLSYYNCTPILAETKIINYPLKADDNQSFSAITQAAKTLAKSTVVRELKQANITTVNIKIVGERNGQKVPLLYTKVARNAWQAEPNISKWRKYFIKAAILLGFDQPSLSTASNISVITSNVTADNLVEDLGYRDD